MTEFKGTPGPWEVGPVDDTVVTHVGKDGLRYEIAAIDGDYNQPETWPVMEANARLIAAAPDLLEALIQLVEIVSGLEAECDNAGVGDLVEVRDAWRKADAAIAKATGAA